MRHWVIVIGVLLLLAGVGGAGYFGFRSTPAKSQVAAPATVAVERGDVQHTVTAPGQSVGAREALVSAGVGGRVSMVGVHPGDKVKAGDVLVQLDDTDLQFALQTAQAGLASAEARLRQLKAPPSEADVAAAQAQLASAQAAYDAAVTKNSHSDDQLTVAKAQVEKAAIAVQSAQTAYDRVAWRDDIGSLPQGVALQQATIDYEAALANYNLTIAGLNDSAVKTAAQSLAQAQANLAKLTSGASQEELAVAQASVDSARVALSQAQARIEQTKVLAPFDGIVQEVRVGRGDTVTSGMALIRITDPMALEARTTVTQEDYPLIKVGQEAEVYLDARPDIVLHGRISHIVPLREPGSSPLYPVYITLDELPEGLTPGMTVDASLLIAKQSNVLRLPRSLVQARSDGTAQVKVWANGQVQARSIQVGLRGDRYVEILSGLSQGELVVSR